MNKDLVEEYQPVNLSPVAKSKRIDVLDIIRGVALLGIVLMNIEWFNRPIIDLSSFNKDLTGLDHATGWLIRCFVEGKLYKLFALLFGMGFAIMLVRAKEANRPFNAWFIRRMTFLLLIGLCHLIFIWSGDILHDYAIAGFILLVYVNLLKLKRLQKYDNPDSILKLSLIWLMFPFIMFTLFGIGSGAYFDNAKVNKKWQEDVEITKQIESRYEDEKGKLLTHSFESEETNETIDDDDNDIEKSPEEIQEQKISKAVKARLKYDQKKHEEVSKLSQGTYYEVLKFQANYSLSALAKAPIFGLMMLMPIFLFGYWMILSNIIREHHKHKRFYKYLSRIGIGVGLLTTVCGLLIMQHPLTEDEKMFQGIGNLLFFFGQITMTAGYLGFIVRMVQSQKWGKYMKFFAPYGKMALTNYISQSLIMVSLFFGYAGGLYGQVSRSQQVLIVLAIFIFQIVFSKLWLNRYRFGPLEWLWRSFTYKKFQSMKIVN